MEKNPRAASRPSARRPAALRIRTVAAGSVLAAVSAAGLGVIGAAPARAAVCPVMSPVSSQSLCGAPAEAGVDRGTRERLAGIRTDLGNAVAWGSVTQAQADRFYAQLEGRILRGL